MYGNYYINTYTIFVVICFENLEYWKRFEYSIKINRYTLDAAALFRVDSVTVALDLYTLHLVRHLPSSGQEFFFFCRLLHSLLY